MCVAKLRTYTILCVFYIDIDEIHTHKHKIQQPPVLTQIVRGCAGVYVCGVRTPLVTHRDGERERERDGSHSLPARPARVFAMHTAGLLNYTLY